MPSNYNICATGSPTYFPYDNNRTRNALDFGIFGGIPSSAIDVVSRCELSSDHVPLLISLGQGAFMRNVRKPVLWGNVDIRLFKSFLIDHIQEDTLLQTPEDIDSTISNLTIKIQEAALQATGRVCSPGPSGHSWHINDDIKTLIRDKRRIRRRWIRFGNPDDNKEWKRLAASIRLALAAIRSTFFEQLLEQADPNSNYDHSLWKLTRNIKRQPVRNLPIQGADGWCIADS